jgi:Icc-related predicted phosphoesterase
MRFAAARPEQHLPHAKETHVTVISDTHLMHESLRLSGGDLLIHCGDMFDLSRRKPSELRKLDSWFGKQPFDKIVCTGGNHDHILEQARARNSQPFRNACYLEDEALQYRGLTIYGAPWLPGLPTHAFHKDRVGLANAWSRVPAGIDILVTHSPPKGILDKSSRGVSFGCPDLARELERISPRVHCFGHVHASAGQTKLGETLFINASSVQSGGTSMQRPISFTLSPRS